MRAASDREKNRRRRLKARRRVDDHDISNVNRDSLGGLFPKAVRPSTAWDDKRVHITGPDRVQDPFHNVTGVEKVSIHVWECVVGLFERPVKKCSIVAVGHRMTVDFRGSFGDGNWINDGQRRVPRPCKGSCDFELIKYGWNLTGEQRYEDVVAVKSAYNRGNSVGILGGLRKQTS